MKRIIFRCKNCGKIVEEIFPSQYSLRKEEVKSEEYNDLSCGCVKEKMVRFEVDEEKTTEEIIIDFYKKERAGEV